jgi:Uma2 family endonuclease
MFPGRPNRVRFPDASVIRLGRLQNDETPDGYVALAPDLAVEVVSPNVEAYEVDDKIEEYLQAGVQLIWIIYSRSKTVMVFRHDGTVGRFKQADDLLGESVLPGFSCRVGDLF